MLKWSERVLLAAGLALAGWCGVVLLESHVVDTLQPPLIVTQTLPDDAANPASSDRPLLPGDAGTGASATPRPGTPRPGAWVARIDAPSVKLSATVLEGTDDGTLNRAAGHIEDTPLPGQPGNAGIAGHRDRHFRPLRHIRVGDPINVRTSQGVFQYRVRRTVIVGPDDVQVLDPTAQPTLTLVTCYPFEFIGHAPKRFIVQAEMGE